MSRAAFTVTKWRKYRSAQLYGRTMEDMIDTDFKHSNPPSSDAVVELMLLGDKQYMTAVLNFPQTLKNQPCMSVAAISHDPAHQFYKKIKNAFGYVNSRRKKVGLSLDKWPIPIIAPRPIPVLSFPGRVENPDRRLVWSLNRREVCSARRIFKRFLRDGLVPFLVGLDGKASRQITVFDPASCEILFQPVSESKS